MALKVFFSFHYERDSQGVSQICGCNSISQHFIKSPFLSRSEWESIERTGQTAVRNWIDKNMDGTSVIILYFGLKTYTRPCVKYELKKTHKENRGICQNIFYEVDKYLRWTNPELAVASGATRIKQKFTDPKDAQTFFFPLKWNINHQIETSCQKKENADIFS